MKTRYDYFKEDVAYPEPIGIFYQAMPGISPCCHKQDFLLKCSKDRTSWLKWLYEAGKCYGLCELNYFVSSNYVYLLVMDAEETYYFTGQKGGLSE